MASEILKVLTGQGNKHTVGSLNNMRIRMINQGAIAEADLDNYMIVETGFNEEGERTFKLLTDITKKGYLLASPENVMADLGETMISFYNGVGERGRLVIQDFGQRFECSNVVPSDNSAPIKAGQSVYFDPSKKAFVAVTKGEDEKLATAGNKYVVVDAKANTLAGQQTIRLEILE
ncbi:hypothetical protein [Clostridium sardiniense]|uniref:hypothetical protein n=1 Tax=Clostridium sardiniense TaxID=29369 RepID=UPI0019578455|nr:hypothetical protein [Clostridium sardiniense]MBM7835742.1 hypothetical protein [Clostridium sardiniense]